MRWLNGMDARIKSGHDGIGMSLCAKRLEKGRFIWPSPADGVDRIAEHPAKNIDQLLPWNWQPRSAAQSPIAA
jgi:transposase